MKFIEGIISAIQGNIKTKLDDPLIGSFIASFVFWNWNSFLLLFFGEKKIDDRIIDCINSFKLSFDGWDDFYPSLLVYLVPVLMTVFYIFFMPYVSIWIAKTVSKFEVSKHEVAVDLEMAQTKKQKDLNEQKLLSDPNKKFLSTVVENNLKLEMAVITRKQDEANIVKDEAAKAKADKAKAEADSQAAISEKEIKYLKSEHEKKKLNVGISVANSMLQANAYSSAFNFVRILSESLAGDSIALTHKSLTEIIAAVFGYRSFDDLLKDGEFNNEALDELKYILLDTKQLGRRLEGILSEDIVDEDVCNAEVVSDHLYELFNSLPYLYGDEDAIADAVYEELENDAYSLIDTDAISSAIADTNTIVEESEFSEKEVVRAKKALKVFINGYASGSHRKESDVPGQGIDLKIEVVIPVKWGKYGLGKYTMDITASPETYDEWEEAEAELEEE